MATVTPYWWPRRRADLTVEQVGYEAATPPAEALDAPAHAPLDEIGQRGARSVAKQFAVVAGICALLFLYVTFNGPSLL